MEPQITLPIEPAAFVQDYYCDDEGHFYAQYSDGFVLHVFMGWLDGEMRAAVNSISGLTLQHIKIAKGPRIVRCEAPEYALALANADTFLRRERPQPCT